ncbi:MAG: pyridoxamine 5'-phosphate oxidase family protein [Hyphomicrobiaceae bacterium]|nr:pyridoxamine 5'-phosphate oxidase family protein [Hyphomicrobiaceae bacterium]
MTDVLQKDLKALALEILSGEHLMALATVRHDGFPQTTWVNYISDQLTLYFACDAASQKAGNIELNPKVSLAIASETKNFNKLKGLSMSGTARRIKDRATATTLAQRLFSELPQSRRFVPQDPLSLAVFAVEPVAISIVDYAQGFGTTHHMVV